MDISVLGFYGYIENIGKIPVDIRSSYLFTIIHFPLKMQDLFLYFEKPFLENGLESPLNFVLF